ncbi:hypothetical protein GDO78_021878 [Eleutherodactylus coqui]|uniref:Uncharacterized protein n=1 Tax=Eleutherodactylus coqui TaxID=57060 RepID=A0A8J6AZT5_ELECQ|nr:hypothetical protein GDO78_021878 [Eleutherodactylus coqui]
MWRICYSEQSLELSESLLDVRVKQLLFPSFTFTLQLIRLLLRPSKTTCTWKLFNGHISCLTVASVACTAQKFPLKCRISFYYRSALQTIRP